MNNKLFATLILSALALPVAATPNPSGADSTVEVEISRAFIAARGFDDNDNVQAVIEGLLPNACYTTTQTEVERALDKGQIRLRQTAHRNERGACAPGGVLPPDLQAPVPYVVEVNLGHLDRGEYTLLYGAVGQRSFLVAEAPTSSTDDLRYATITNAFADDVVSENDSTFEVRITGQLNSSCAVLSDAKVILERDVVIVLLGIEKQDDYCLPANKPFYKVLNVRTPTPGRYLLHVRSLAGQAKNKLFTVGK